MSHALPRVLLLFAAAFALVAANPAPGRLGTVTTLVGDATLTRGAAAPRPVAFKDEVKPGDTIRTTPGALVRVLVRGATLVAIGESSTVALAADAGRSNVRLESGTVSVVASGAKRVRAGGAGGAGRVGTGGRSSGRRAQGRGGGRGGAGRARGRGDGAAGPDAV